MPSKYKIEMDRIYDLQIEIATAKRKANALKKLGHCDNCNGCGKIWLGGDPLGREPEVSIKCDTCNGMGY